MPSWVGHGHDIPIILIGVPYLYCDVCNAAILEWPPDGVKIVATGKWGSFGSKEYRLEPDIDTPEWWDEARKKHGWQTKVFYRKAFTVCKKCGTANEPPGPQAPAGGRPESSAPSMTDAEDLAIQITKLFIPLDVPDTLGSINFAHKASEVAELLISAPKRRTANEQPPGPQAPAGGNEKEK